MKVTMHTRYRITSHDYLWKKGDIENIAPIAFEYCCDEMKDAVGDNFISVGEYDTMLNRDANVNIYQCSPYPEGAVWSAMPLKYCPFCAAKITIEEKENAA